MNITIIGGGNIGTQFAVHCAEKGHCVTVYTSRPHEFHTQLFIVNENNTPIHEGVIYHATDDIKSAVSHADVIFITVPAYCMADIAHKIAPHIKEGTKIGLIPGTGGGECPFHAYINKKAMIFGLQRVPSVARLIKYGERVRAVGYRDELHVAALSNKDTPLCCSLMEHLFDKKCIGLPNYLNLTLTPSNPILHTTRLYTLFKNYRSDAFYPYLPLFYEDWDDTTSDLLFQCDTEVQTICKALRQFDLSYVKSLQDHYSSYTPTELTKKIHSIAGFKGITTPAIKTERGYIPDFESRYFTADFPFGLAILVQVAQLTRVNVPVMERILSWYVSQNKDKTTFNYSSFGIHSLEQFETFYNQ